MQAERGVLSCSSLNPVNSLAPIDPKVPIFDFPTIKVDCETFERLRPSVKFSFSSPVSRLNTPSDTWRYRGSNRWLLQQITLQVLLRSNS